MFGSALSSKMLIFYDVYVDGAWHHRKWIVNRFEVDRAAELELCKQFLKLDQRNFHCWAYRRFVTTAALQSVASTESQTIVVEEEFAFSTSKIQDNFSNYSAFHHRSIYIQEILNSGIKDIRSIVNCEIDLLENAIFTEPYDQSAWWYMHFLVLWVQRLSQSDADTNHWFVQAVLHKLIHVVRSLLELEPSCKWAHTAVVTLVDVLLMNHTAFPALSVEVSAEYALASLSAAELRNLRKRTLELLVETDSMHASRYRYLLISAL
jgi:hypothetical protein